MKRYTKAEAIEIVVRCAQAYKKELDGKSLLFLCTDKHKSVFPFEFTFYGNNYLHLTGLKAPKDKNGKTMELLNCTPFVRQYDILSNKWGVLLCQREYQTNDIRRNSRKWL